MKKVRNILLAIILPIIAIGIYYYNTLPAINIHAVGFWYTAIIIALVITAIVIFLKMKQKSPVIDMANLKPKAFMKEALRYSIVKICVIITVLLILVFIGGSILSSPIVNADDYRNLIQVKEANFTDDIKQISYKEIPILDKDSAVLLGTKKMGNMIEYVSQFEVSNDYTQINANGSPVRVSPLEYGSVIKWFTNRKDGIPAYMKIDMATQNIECVKLEQGIKYSKSEHFGRNIYRYIRFKFPTYIFDELNFEIDDNGVPYWVCPVKAYTIGLFGGETISNVVLVNAITGDYTDYKIDEVPTWIDRVYSAELLIDYYDYYGTLKNGYFNSIFSQRDSLQTTDGYNYIALNDDVWVYTGVTSVGQDLSNVGFVLMNQRTAETKYYSNSGAEEYSAMGSAEGKVQHLGYQATFPILLNIAGEPTYFMALKDSAGLVKQYAMVNIEKYTIVAIGDSVTACEKSYIELLKSNNVTVTDTTNMPKVTGIISKVAEAVIDGNSHYYIMLEGNNTIFDASLTDLIGIIRFNVGDTISFTYSEGSEYNTILQIN